MKLLFYFIHPSHSYCSFMLHVRGYSSVDFHFSSCLSSSWLLVLSRTSTFHSQWVETRIKTECFQEDRERRFFLEINSEGSIPFQASEAKASNQEKGKEQERGEEAMIQKLKISEKTVLQRRRGLKRDVVSKI